MENANVKGHDRAKRPTLAGVAFEKRASSHEGRGAGGGTLYCFGDMAKFLRHAFIARRIEMLCRGQK